MLIDLVHFPKNAAPATIDIVAPHAVRNLVLIYMPVQIALWIVAISLVTGYRINRETHENNLKRLAEAAALAEIRRGRVRSEQLPTHRRGRRSRRMNIRCSQSGDAASERRRTRRTWQLARQAVLRLRLRRLRRQGLRLRHAAALLLQPGRRPPGGSWSALAILVVLLFDAFADPIVGQISDNLRTRWGRRHPFMYASAFPVAMSYFFLWMPPHLGAGRHVRLSDRDGDHRAHLHHHVRDPEFRDDRRR